MPDQIFTLIANACKQFVIDSGYPGIADYLEIFLIAIAIAIPFVWKLLKKIIKYIRNIRVSKDLHPFYNYDTVSNALNNFVPTKCQNIDPTNEMEPSQSFGFAVKDKLIPFFIKQVFKSHSENRFSLILADSGMGKTTFMLNLYYKYSKKFFKKYSLKLLPIGKGIENEIANIPDKTNTILLLDGLDEDPESLNDIHSRLNQLINVSKDFRKVIVTCRTHFFDNEINEPRETGITSFGTNGNPQHIFKKLYISPFDDEDIKIYLRKKYGRLFNIDKKKQARNIIRKSPNLMVRPMLLNYLDDLIIDENQSQDFRFTYNIYTILIDKWLDRESQRIDLVGREEYKTSLYKFTIGLATEMAKNQVNKGLLLDKNTIKRIAEEYEIKLSLLELQGRSLLNRNSIGQIKFAHKSIFEYFVARICVENMKMHVSVENVIHTSFPIDFTGLDQAVNFIDENFIINEIDYSSRFNKLQNLNFIRNIISPTFTDDITESQDVQKLFEDLNNDDENLISSMSNDGDAILNIKKAIELRNTFSLNTEVIKQLLFSVTGTFPIPTIAYNHIDKPNQKVFFLPRRVNSDAIYEFVQIKAEPVPSKDKSPIVKSYFKSINGVIKNVIISTISDTLN